jgi:hypothetical protein
MIDHMLGRPSVKSRRLQVLAVLTVWTAVLARYVCLFGPFFVDLSVIRVPDTTQQRP